MRQHYRYHHQAYYNEKRGYYGIGKIAAKENSEFKCDLCHKSFAHKRSLDKHIRISHIKGKQEEEDEYDDVSEIDEDEGKGGGKFDDDSDETGKLVMDLPM